MKVVILAGGFGTRITEESHLKPKPMVEIGGYPILWHIMKIYSAQGYTDFVICLGYKGFLVKEYFANYLLRHSDVTFDFSNGETSFTVQSNKMEPWKIALIETGANTMTGGRMLRARKVLGEENFLMTYGDGVADVNLEALLIKHKLEGGIATLTATQPSGRFGALTLGSNSEVISFVEKPKTTWVNGGFFAFTPEIFDYLDGDATALEGEPLNKLAQENKLFAYEHRGFWQPMDTIRDRNVLEELWNSGTAPWKIWKA